MTWRIAMLALALCTSAQAQVRPVAGAGDPRIQTVIYDADQVVQLAAAPGFQMMVRFASGEHVETIAVGDSAAWQVTASRRGDAVFVKNLLGSGLTNMTIVTDARTYAFDLVSSSYAGEAPYVVRFVYPSFRSSPQTPSEAETVSYRISGSRKIRPSYVSQSEGQIYVEWPDNAQMPAIFAIDDGRETLVNGEMIDGRYVIAGAPDRLIFRLDNAKASAVRTTKRKQGK
jgi:type IV secretion system protein VirB9